MEAVRRKTSLMIILSGFISFQGLRAQTITEPACLGREYKPITSNLYCECSDELMQAAPQWYGPISYYPSEQSPSLIRLRSLMPLRSNGALSRVYVENLSPIRTALVIVNLNAADEGVYTCSISPARNGNQSMDLRPYEPMSIAAPDPQFLVVNESSRLLNCAISGTLVSFSWWKLNGLLINVSSSRYNLTSAGLIAYNVTDADAGTYQCRAIQQVPGLFNFATAEFTVYAYTIPTIVYPTEKFNVTAYIFDSVQLDCQASSFPAPEYSFWREPDSPFGRWLFVNSTVYGSRFQPNTTSGTLKIVELRLDDSAIYRCIATNPAGSNFVDIELVVLELPTTVSDNTSSFTTFEMETDTRSSSSLETQQAGHAVIHQLSSSANFNTPAIKEVVNSTQNTRLTQEATNPIQGILTTTYATETRSSCTLDSTTTIFRDEISSKASDISSFSTFGIRRSYLASITLQIALQTLRIIGQLTYINQ